MNILVTGNMGYIGPVLGGVLKKNIPGLSLTGFDRGFFTPNTINDKYIADRYYDKQIFKDIRDICEDDLEGIDSVICLAAISNDPMGNKFEQITHEINEKMCIKLANLSKNCGVSRFVFASSCSVYGAASDYDKTEEDDVNPLTAYAKSKINVEKNLKGLESPQFKIKCLRFATACGASPRLRLDLVLNDFVTSALKNGVIDILSDGTPWRPLIDVEDMSLAMYWAAIENDKDVPNYLIMNVGCNEWNFQVKQLAELVAQQIPNVLININHSAPPDKRSYRVNFSLFKKYAPNFYAQRTIQSTIKNLIYEITNSNKIDKDFRNSSYLRLNQLNQLIDSGVINAKLRFADV